LHNFNFSFEHTNCIAEIVIYRFQFALSSINNYLHMDLTTFSKTMLDDCITVMSENHLFDIEATRKKFKEPIPSETKKHASEFEKVVNCFCDIMLVNLNTCLDESDGKHDGRIAALALSCCMIDTFAGFYAGSRLDDKNVGKNWKLFVEKYLPQYLGLPPNKQILYTGLRCKLLHNFSEGVEGDGKLVGAIDLIGGEAPAGYKFESAGRYTIYVTTFVRDVVEAITTYLKDVLAGKTVTIECRLDENLKKHFKDFGILEIKPAVSSAFSPKTIADASKDTSAGSTSGKVST